MKWFILLCVSLSFSEVVSLERFLNLAQENNPVFNSAELLEDNNERTLQAANGAFDPYLSYSAKVKNFDSKEYYNVQQANVVLPMELGLELQTGYQLNEGEFLNPENKVPKEGLGFVGIKANLIKNLLMDKRRAGVLQAKIDQQINELKTQIQVEDYRFKLKKDYLNWVIYQSLDALYRETAQLAEVYFNNVKLSFESGEKAAIDTVEANILYQDRLMDQRINTIALFKYQQKIQSHIFVDSIPFDNMIADTNLFYQRPQPYIEAAELKIESLPYMRELDFKARTLKVEERLKKEKMKPKLELTYNPYVYNSEEVFFEENNQLWGVKFSMPLFFREGRGDVALNRIKQKELMFKQRSTQNKLQAEMNAIFQMRSNLESQIQMQAQIVTSNDQLLAAEYSKLQGGESSIFLLNKRLEKLIKSKTELLKLKREWLVNNYYLQYLESFNRLAWTTP